MNMYSGQRVATQGGQELQLEATAMGELDTGEVEIGYYSIPP